jgi:hypothetical protein
MIDVAKAVQNGYAMMIAANRAISKPLPSYEHVSADDMKLYTEIVEFFIKHPDELPSGFYDRWGSEKPYDSLPMEMRIMYARLHRAAFEAIQEQGEQEDTQERKGWISRWLRGMRKILFGS